MMCEERHAIPEGVTALETEIAELAHSRAELEWIADEVAQDARDWIARAWDARRPLDEVDRTIGLRQREAAQLRRAMGRPTVEARREVEQVASEEEGTAATGGVWRARESLGCDEVPGSYVLAVDNEESLARCVRACEENSLCTHVTHDTNTQTCTLSGFVDPESASVDPAACRPEAGVTSLFAPGVALTDE